MWGCRAYVARLPWTSSVMQQLRRCHHSPAHDDAGFTEWRTIYSLPGIRLVAAFCKLKVYQAAITAAGMPIAFALGHAGQVTTDALSIYAAIGVSGLATLTIASYAARNLVGFIYVNEQQDLLKLAYVDFWGRRKETLVDPGDLLPSWEHRTPSRLRIVSPICLRSDPSRRYKLLSRFGYVSDPQLFEGLFGD